MPTTTVKTIGSTGDYSTLQAWEDASPANLVTADEIWRGECQNQTFSSTTTLLTIAGSTSDATRYKELTTASGASFRDHASKATNALTYNASLGAAIDLTGNYQAGVVVTENYTRISNLMIRGASADTSIPLSHGALNGRLDNCIIDNRSTSTAVGAATAIVCSGDNNVLIRRRAAVNVAAVSGSLAATWKNWTLMLPNDFSASSQLIRATYGTLTLINCAAFNCTDPASGGATINKTNCYTDATATGWTTAAFDASTGSGFENITSASLDLRIRSTSSLKDAGSASGASTDIIGTSRTGSFDVGAWEYASAAASHPARRAFPRPILNF